MIGKYAVDGCIQACCERKSCKVPSTFSKIMAGGSVKCTFDPEHVRGLATILSEDAAIFENPEEEGSHDSATKMARPGRAEAIFILAICP
jgi:hypothetical protein